MQGSKEVRGRGRGREELKKVGKRVEQNKVQLPTSNVVRVECRQVRRWVEKRESGKV